MKFFIPNYGDTVRVRLHTGEVVEAVYEFESYRNERMAIHHLRDKNGKLLIAIKGRPTIYGHECRFIGPSCDLVPL